MTVFWRFFGYGAFAAAVVLSIFTRSWLTGACTVVLGLVIVLDACGKSKRELLDDRDPAAEEVRRNEYRRLRRD